MPIRYRRIDIDTVNVPRHIFKDGDHALILDRKGRRYLVKLNTTDHFHTHLGNFKHSDLIGQQEGVRLSTSRGHSMLAIKPTLADFTSLMPRIATVVYPKDLGAIVMYGDIFNGARVLEAGTGSGAVTITLLRAVGKCGHVFSYDIRTDMIQRALDNITAVFPQHPHLTLGEKDVYAGFEETDIDRIVLDLAEPWRVVPHASKALVPGGILVSFVPTVMQFNDLTRALRDSKNFDVIETNEVLVRPWSVSGRSIRPVQRMVSHTGFITTARRCSPRDDKEDRRR